MLLLCALLSFASLVWASQMVAFFDVTACGTQSLSVESLVAGRRMLVTEVVISILEAFPSEILNKTGPVEVVFKPPVGEPLVANDYDFWLLLPVHARQCELLSIDKDTDHAAITDLRYYPYTFVEKTANTQAQLILTIQPAIGLFHSLSKFFGTFVDELLQLSRPLNRVAGHLAPRARSEYQWVIPTFFVLIDRLLPTNPANYSRRFKTGSLVSN